MNEQVLCIIDMQDYFNDNASKCLKGVLNEIAHAKANKIPIMVVEYWSGRHSDPYPLSPTNKPILDALKWYRHKTFVKKFEDGGGNEIAEVAEKNGISIDNIRMVGVNRTYCVLSTAEQLKSIQAANNRPGIIEVVRGASACNTSTMRAGLRSLRHVGVTIVNQHPKFNS